MQSTFNQILFIVPFFIFFLLATYNLVVCRKLPQAKKLGPLNPEKVSVYVPVFNDYQVLNSLPVLARMEYPNFVVKILDDSNDPNLIGLIDRFVLNHKNFSLIRRSNRSGFKGGAIENALKTEESPFICVLDCDFRPTNDFLSNIVRSMEQEKADAVQGYQRYVRESNTFLGSFYRASAATSIISLFGRQRLNLAPIIYGSCFIIRTDIAKRVGFSGESVAEDINFSIRAYQRDNFRLVVTPQVFADGGCPATFKDYILQQLRWCETTIRDVFVINFHNLLKIKSSRKKFDLLINGLHYTSGFFLFWFFIALLFVPVNPIIGLVVAMYTTLGFAYPLLLGASLEGYNWVLTTKVLLFGFLLVYIMCPIMTYGFFRGLISKKGKFIVTGKK